MPCKCIFAIGKMKAVFAIAFEIGKQVDSIFLSKCYYELAAGQQEEELLFHCYRVAVLQAMYGFRGEICYFDNEYDGGHYDGEIENL